MNGKSFRAIEKFSISGFSVGLILVAIVLTISLLVGPPAPAGAQGSAATINLKIIARKVCAEGGNAQPVADFQVVLGSTNDDGEPTESSQEVTVRTGADGTGSITIPRGSYRVWPMWPAGVMSKSIRRRIAGREGAKYPATGNETFPMKFPERPFAPADQTVVTDFEIELEMTGSCASPKPQWVRITGPSGKVEYKDDRLVFTSNSVSFTDLDSSGKQTTNAVTWETPPERKNEGEEFTLRVSTTANPGAAISAFWDAYDKGLTNQLWGVNSYGSDAKSNESKFVFRPTGKGYEYAYIELKDSYTGSSTFNGFRIRWDYKREGAPPDSSTPVSTSADLIPVGRVIVAGKNAKLLLSYELKVAILNHRKNKGGENVFLPVPGGDEDELALEVGDVLYAGAQIDTGPEGAVVAELSDKRTILFKSSTKGLFSTPLNPGQVKLVELVLKSGEVKVTGDKPQGQKLNIKTNTLTTSDDNTIFTVSYDEQAQSTTVGVEDGSVTITPANAALAAFTLVAGQQVEVTAKNVGSISPFSGERRRSAIRTYVYLGIGAIILLVVLALIGKRKAVLAQK